MENGKGREKEKRKEKGGKELGGKTGGYLDWKEGGGEGKKKGESHAKRMNERRKGRFSPFPLSLLLRLLRYNLAPSFLSFSLSNLTPPSLLLSLLT